MIPTIILTPGEPAGIGPDIALIATQNKFNAEIVITGDISQLKERAKLLGLSVNFSIWNPLDKKSLLSKGEIKLIPVCLSEKCVPGTPNSKNAKQVIQCLQIANNLCLKKQANAIVTGPVEKAILNEYYPGFTGHTEFFADISKTCQTPVMLFTTPKQKIALVTTHLPLSEVPKSITKNKLVLTFETLITGLKNIFNIEQPRITVCGLNPHAGENGLLGKEEQEIIIPVIKKMIAQGNLITGPVAADTAFISPKDKYSFNKTPPTDVIVAMYHDQALPAIKALSFGQLVNTTLGLPYIRTSVDHGVAYDKAGTKLADATSLATAIETAIELASNSCR